MRFRLSFLCRLCLAALLCCACAAAPVHARAETAQPLKIGFIYSGPVGEAGWSYSHDLARRELGRNPANTMFIAESIPFDEDAERVIRTMSENGCDIIATTSFGYMDATLKVAADYPKTTYLHCSGYMTAENVSNYFGRMYQARYLTGLVAGGMTKSNIIGFVAAFPIPEVVRAVNAFTVGVRESNPQAEVHVLWTRTWYDPALEKESAEKLIERGADVIAQHQDSPAAQMAAQEKGVYSVGYHSDMSAFAPDAHLVAAIWNWTDFYTHVAEEVRAGTWHSGSFWPGLESGIVGLSPFGPMVPEALAKKTLARRDEIASGKLSLARGPLFDNTGTLRLESDTTLTDKDLREMDWFVKGVVLPPE